MYRFSTRPISLLIVLAALVGCGRKAEVPKENAQARVKLSFWHILNYSGPKEVIEDAVSRFEQAHPDVDVEVQTFDNDAYKTKLSIEMASGTPPDVFFTWGGGALGAYADAGKVVDLTDELAKDGWRERFLPQGLGICSQSGRAYGVPLDLSCVVVWYNRDLFEQHGVAVPASYEQFLAAIGRLRARKVTPLALGNMKQWPGAFYFIYLAAREGGAQLFFDAAAGRQGASFADPAFVAAGGRLRELVDLGAFTKGFNGVDDAQARVRFVTGKAAMYTMGTWLVARIKDEDASFLEKMECFPFPAPDGGKGDPTTVVGGVNAGFAISTACARRDLAVELLRALTASDVARAWCGIGRIPAVVVGSEELELLPPATRKALGVLRSAAAFQPYYDQYLPPRLAVVHKKTTQGLFAGTTTPAEAAQKMAKAASARE